MFEGLDHGLGNADSSTLGTPAGRFVSKRISNVRGGCHGLSLRRPKVATPGLSTHMWRCDPVRFLVRGTRFTLPVCRVAKHADLRMDREEDID